MGPENQENCAGCGIQKASKKERGWHDVNGKLVCPECAKEIIVGILPTETPTSKKKRDRKQKSYVESLSSDHVGPRAGIGGAPGSKGETEKRGKHPRREDSFSRRMKKQLESEQSYDDREARKKRNALLRKEHKAQRRRERRLEAARAKLPLDLRCPLCKRIFTRSRQWATVPLTDLKVCLGCLRTLKASLVCESC